jgi:hypothetical protein
MTGRTVAIHIAKTTPTRVRKSARPSPADRENLGAQGPFGGHDLCSHRDGIRSHLGESVLDLPEAGLDFTLQPVHFRLDRRYVLTVRQRLHKPIEAPARAPFKGCHREFAKAP